MRLFIAVNFSEQMKAALTDIQAQIKKQDIDGNFTKPENLHLTLAFIGEYHRPDHVMKALDKVKFRRFTLSLDGFGNFGSLWWAGISDGGELKSISSQVRRHLADARIPFDKKRFSPHITLLREATKPVLPALVIPDAQTAVERISLMRSERGKKGMIYTEIGSVECVQQ